MVSCQESKHSLQPHPHDAALVNAHSFVSMGGGGNVLPLPQCCTFPAHEEATLPLSLLPLPWLLSLQSPLPSLLPLLTPLPSPSLLPIAVAVGHCRCSCCQSLLPPSLLCCRRPSPMPLPLMSAIAVLVTVGQRRCHPCRPSPSPLPSPLPSAISESCCLGVARIVFKQFKQRMLTLFYFVWILGSALIKAG
jgi:hypothetical protein